MNPPPHPGETGVDLPRPGRCVVLGVLNVTPDSYSDGGRFLDLDHAVDHGISLHAAGADLVDVGGESTPPRSCGGCCRWCATSSPTASR